MLKFYNDNVFFISDIHFNHKNIIQYDNRPFDNIIQMNDIVIQNWNKKITNNDIVFFLGDFAFANVENLSKYANALNGKIYFIKGNHDILKDLKKTNRFEDIFTFGEEISIQKQHIILCHFPLMEWHGKENNSWHLHGHSHGKLYNTNPLYYENCYVKDVSSNMINYTPISFNEIKKEFEQNK